MQYSTSIAPPRTGNTRNKKNKKNEPKKSNGHKKLTLVVEPVDPVDGSALVVSAQNEEVLGVLDLVRQQQADGLQALLTPVHVVPAPTKHTRTGEGHAERKINIT